MRGAINRIVFLIVDPFDDVSLFAHTGVWENGVGGRERLEVGFERTDIDGGPAGNVFAEIKGGCDFLDIVETGELSDAHAHGVARLNESVRTGLNAAVSAVGISGRPISRAFDFARLNRAVADGRARQKSIRKSERVDERFESGPNLTIGRCQRAIEFALRVIATANQRANPAAGIVDCDDRSLQIWHGRILAAVRRLIVRLERVMKIGLPLALV